MTAYEIRISDWSSDVCSSDLDGFGVQAALDGLDALVQRRLVVVGQHGHRILGADRPGVDLEGRDVDRAAGDLPAVIERRSDVRRVGTAWVSTRRSRWSTYHYKKTHT